MTTPLPTHASTSHVPPRYSGVIIPDKKYPIISFYDPTPIPEYGHSFLLAISGIPDWCCLEKGDAHLDGHAWTLTTEPEEGFTL